MDTTQLLKGVLDVAALAVIEQEDGYGYDVVRRLREAGLDDIAEASVYGTLRRLFNAGLLTSYVVASDAGPHRKYYGLNDIGRAQLTESRSQWEQFVKTMDAVLTKGSAA
ncbi:MAG TPA: PadR family transcriptional regulator [Actinomycetes bacterium]|nr:PadR family transcriptional regulator [Actinomycetes bacterium]